MSSHHRRPLFSSAVAVLVCIAATGLLVSADDDQTADNQTADNQTNFVNAITTKASSTVATTTATTTPAATTTIPAAPRRCTLANLTTSDAIKLSVLIRDRIYCFSNTTDEDGVRYHALIAGIMRLAFHSNIDRSQGGCINLRDPRQAGLRVAVEELEQLYQQSLTDSYYAKVSRADFWALAAIVALERATSVAVSITFRYGRCDACIDTFDTNATIDLPSQTFSGNQTVGYLQRLFNLNEYEAVALMGAHSLGVVRDSIRNVLYGKWVVNPEALSNGYFADMINKGFKWKQVKREFALQQPSEVWSWTHGSDNKRVYLNCDMGLYKVLNAADDGESSCEYTDCPPSRFYLVVESYAKFETVFRSYFRAAFEKMVNGNIAGLRIPV